MHYQCKQCDMSVKGLQCGKCNCDLVHSSIDVDGQQIQVSKCEACGGMIKSPQCCGHDMSSEA